MVKKTSKKKTKKTKRRKGGKFAGYQRRGKDTWKQKAQESSGNFDRYVFDNVARFAARDGRNRIRVLPPTWPDADDWGFTLFVHYGVGPDEQSYLCPKEMKNEECPVCQEVAQLVKAGETDDAKKLRAKKRFAAWVVDRKDEGDGAQFWAMPFTVRQEAYAAAEDEDGDVYEFDHPDKGYDVLFQKEGSRDRTRYTGVKLSRKSLPVSDDPDEQQRWLNYITEHPIPDVLKFYPADYISGILSGGVSSDEDEEDLDEDEDEEEEEEEEEDDDAEEEEEDDDDEEEEEEDDDDEDEDEEDDDDEDEDEEEEDEPKRKSKKGKSKKGKSKTKSKSDATRRLKKASKKRHRSTL